MGVVLDAAHGDELDRVLTDKNGRRASSPSRKGSCRRTSPTGCTTRPARILPPQFRQLVGATAEPFVQTIQDLAVPRMAFGRVCLTGDAAFVPRPHTAASTAKAAANALALADALADTGDVVEALRQWEPGQLASGEQLRALGRPLGHRSQFA